MKWITRERPKIDRLACPWLIKKFIDHEAEFIFVPASEVLYKSKELNATPFDIPNVEYSHYGEKVTFDYFLDKYNLDDKPLKKMALIIRGADTDRHDLSPEIAGLWAITYGLSQNISDDHELLNIGFILYEALYTWCKQDRDIKHLNGSPFEQMLHEVYQKFLNNKTNNIPQWVNELKQLIQDQLDTQFNIELKNLSDELNLNPSYLSREFPKHFENQNFGEYIRHARISKAIQLFENEDYNLAEIAYLTGFSDQSHFSRVFKQVIGEKPADYRKKMKKSKVRSKE